MHDLDLFQQALGLVEPWEVVDVKFDAERRRLDLRVDFRKGARFPCPECGVAGSEGGSVSVPGVRGGRVQGA